MVSALTQCKDRKRVGCACCLSGNKGTGNFPRSAGIFSTSCESSLIGRKLRLGGESSVMRTTTWLKSVFELVPPGSSGFNQTSPRLPVPSTCSDSAGQAVAAIAALDSRSRRGRRLQMAAAVHRSTPVTANSCNRLGILELSECADCERPDLPKRPRQSSRCTVVRDL